MKLFTKNKKEAKNQKNDSVNEGAVKAGEDKNKPAKKEIEKPESKKANMKELYDDKKAGAKKEKSSSDGAGKEVKVRAEKIAYRVLVKPMITEKASILGGENKYVFVVNYNVNKIEIARAIEEVYGVTPKSVNVIRMKGKKVIRGKSSGKRKNWKKAIITLPKGQTIQVYEGI